ncbi:dienelactone hydrolase family protein [Parvibaculum sp.]|uniref:dienelactone hydrolase family protein n=1 Tax=Parvibaculum sp. TaxID=2024848 RepID=UPI000C475D6C|nr:dienelactone hydrolase family protein [Parvibaculum sp.]MAU61201.1 carboxymethylenebutenolidase [Parvibaculum sp.]MBO6668429.1 dienelactone hydrolase family protein [Parvibaculum sp.]MBO6691324.1 dienelactone hydrolase family protein [Parvibaculum sp.]MBO6715364.1 dienelactone hydrolase family protein [Parvibaculum sp.]
MSGETITIKGPDGSFSGYLSKPKSGTGPGIVVIQEIFGVNKVMRDLTDWYASQGFVALCPDLFWRIEPGIDITDQTEEEWKQAFDLFGKFDVDKGIVDIGATIDTLRPMTTGKVGAVGYCLGGQLAYLTACHTSSDASVGYYGVNIQNRLDDAKGIKKPLMLHIAGKDEFVPPEAQEQVVAGLRDNSHVTIHRYPDNDHAFARPGGAHYDKKTADEANDRTVKFFQRHLG